MIYIHEKRDFCPIFPSFDYRFVFIIRLFGYLIKKRQIYTINE